MSMIGMANKETRQQANKQKGKQARKQADKQANKRWCPRGDQMSITSLC